MKVAITPNPKNHSNYVTNRRSKKLALAALGLGALLGWPSPSPASEEGLSIVRITPEGDDVPPGRQIVLQFDRPVVPIGRMERTPAEVPVKIDPPLECQWRWLNNSSLACQLGEKQKMTPATAYKVSVAEGLEAMDGSALAEGRDHTFTTELPKITGQWFKIWRSPGMPEIRIQLNQTPTGASIAEHVFFRAGEKRVGCMPKKVKGWEGRLWTVAPAEGLPEDEPVSLEVEPGIVSREGPLPGNEQRVVTEFHTFPQFRFLGVSCRDLQRETVFTPAGSDPELRCDPLSAILLAFSSPPVLKSVQSALTITPDPAAGNRDVNIWKGVYSYSTLKIGNDKGSQYLMPLPYGLKAFSKYGFSAGGSSVQDLFGRTLGDQKLEGGFLTDHRLPKYLLEHDISVLEKGVDSHLPIYATNLQSVDLTYQTMTSAGVKGNRTKSIPLYDAKDVSYRFPIKIREILEGSSGVVQANMRTSPATAEGSSWFFSQVTPFHVHAKLGHFDSLVWVTSLADGKPVAGAKIQVSVNNMSNLSSSVQPKGSAVSDENGLATLPGVAELDPKREIIQQWDTQKPRLFVTVEKDGDLAVVPIGPQLEVSDYNSYPVTRPHMGHLRAWGSTAQGIYKLGDTIQYKLYVRNQDNKAFVAAPRKGYKLQIFDSMDKQVAEIKDLELSEFGAYDGELRLGKSGPVGWYRFALTSSFSKESWEPLRVLVSDFTPAPFKVTSELNAKSYREEDNLEIGTSARLHAGGPYGDAAARLTVTLDYSDLQSDDPKLRGFEFSAGESFDSRQLYQTEERLDSKGDLSTSFKLAKSEAVYGELSVESAVRDDRGKYVAATSRAKFNGRDRYVGLRQSDWILEKGKPASVEAAVIDEGLANVAGSAISVKIERQKLLASRVKGPGNAYLVKYISSWEQTGGCELVSGADPIECIFTPPEPGSYKITASVKDSKGREHNSELYRWASGRGEVIWDNARSTSLRMNPEKNGYKVGDTARFFIQNPYPGARALFTIERFGVQKSWVQTLQDSAAIVEFPITEDHLPGIYFSAVLMSPRVAGELNEENVDLAKPAYRMGYQQIQVSDPYKELEVSVKAPREIYKPREQVSLEISGRPRHGEAGALEYAVTVLDESVFDLLSGGRAYFDPYAGFYTLDNLDVRNYNLISAIVGRQKFEKKGAPAGGDGGGNLDMRSLFKFVSYWNPSVKAGPDGAAEVSFELPDNLTGWKVFVMAVNRGDRMGLGETSFKANKDTELRPALPNQVMEGDSFEAAFTVMNRTDRTRDLRVQLSAAGPVEDSPVIERSVSAKPFERHTLRLPVTVNGPGQISLSASAGDDSDRDALTLPLTVKPKRSLVTAASYGMSSSPDQSVEEVIELPEDIHTDKGRISMLLSPSVITDLDGAFKYMRDYPYICWEQMITKAVMAAGFEKLKPYLSKEIEWKDAKQVANHSLGLLSSHQAPNGGMCFFVAKDDYASPYLSAYTALALNWLRKSGFEIPEQPEKRLHAYLADFLKHDKLPDQYDIGMASSVRAVALSALAERGAAEKSELSRLKPHLKEMNLFGQSFLLSAARSLGDSKTEQKRILNAILAHANESGGKIAFTEEHDQRGQRMLESSLRTSCAILSALVSQSEGAPVSGKGLGELPIKLARSISQTRKGEHWENTQENVFCTQALLDFSRRYESAKPDLSFEVAVDGERLGNGEFDDRRDEPLELDRAIRRGDAGTRKKLTLSRRGPGALYYGARLFYAPRSIAQDPINSGIEIRREYSVERNGSWKLLSSPMEIETGELVKVDLFVSLAGPRNFVVVDDPVPGGLEPVNRDLATASGVDAAKGSVPVPAGSFYWERNDWQGYGLSLWSFYHKELRHDSARFYSEYLPAGNYHLSYTAQAIAPGSFAVLPTHAEEMYDPDVFGKSSPGELRVEAAE